MTLDRKQCRSITGFNGLHARRNEWMNENEAYCRSFFLALWWVSRPSERVFSWSGSAWANEWSPNHFTHICMHTSKLHISTAPQLTWHTPAPHWYLPPKLQTAVHKYHNDRCKIGCTTRRQCNTHVIYSHMWKECCWLLANLKGKLNLYNKWQSDDLFHIAINENHPRGNRFWVI